MVPPVEVTPGTLEKLDEIQNIQQTRMMVEQRMDLLFQQLDLSDLDTWSDRNQEVAKGLLAEYQDIFSLEPGEFGCTDLAKHEIGVVNDEPFNGEVLKNSHPMVDEVHAHMKEMLEVGHYLA